MTQQGRLARTLVSMADTLVEDYDLLEFLYDLSEVCAELLDATACGVLLIDGHGQLVSTAATTFGMRTLEAFEGTAREGPCFDAYAIGETIVESDIGARGDRWPEFVPRAVELGFVAALAQPLRWRGVPIGALNVFRDRPEPFDTDHVSASRALADMATIGILNARAYAESQEQVRNLQRALESRATVEQAKALLADRLGVSTDDAFHLLRGHARNHNRKLREVAQAYLTGHLPADALQQE